MGLLTFDLGVVGLSTSRFDLGREAMAAHGLALPQRDTEGG
jgi:hypothetical protein